VNVRERLIEALLLVVAVAVVARVVFGLLGPLLPSLLGLVVVFLIIYSVARRR
jgi:hypothetical protein